MEKLAYELRLKKAEVKETFIWGQKGEKMHSRQRKQPELRNRDLKQYREFPGGEAQTDRTQSEWKWEETMGGKGRKEIETRILKALNATLEQVDFIMKKYWWDTEKIVKGLVNSQSEENTCK